MPVYSYGIKSIKSSEIAAATGLPVELTDVGEVYEESADFTQEDPTTTDHMSEFKDDPIITIQRKGMKQVVFSLMDTAAANLVEWLGGTVTEVVDEPDQWEEPSVTPQIFKAMEFEFEDGSIYGIRRGKVSAKLIPSPTRAGITLLEVTVRPLQPLVEDLKSTYKRDPDPAV